MLVVAGNHPLNPCHFPGCEQETMPGKFCKNQCGPHEGYFLLPVGGTVAVTEQ